MNISTSHIRTPQTSQAARKGPVRQAVESTAGFIGGIAGAVTYAAPAGEAGAGYARDGYGSSNKTGSTAVASTFLQSALVGTVAGAVAGGLSKGWMGAGLGAVLGFTAGGVSGVAGVALQNVAGRDDVNSRLGNSIRAGVDKAFEGKVKGPFYNLKDNTAATVRGFRPGPAPEPKLGLKSVNRALPVLFLVSLTAWLAWERH